MDAAALAAVRAAAGRSLTWIKALRPAAVAVKGRTARRGRRRRAGMLKEGSMEGASKWVIGGLVAILGVLGLFAASLARDDNMYYVGVIVFVAAVVFVYGLIGHYAGRHEPGA